MVTFSLVNTPYGGVAAAAPVPAAAYSAEATTLFAAMTVQPNAARKTLIDSTITSLKANGIWAKKDWIIVLAAADQQSALLNWKNPAKSLSVVGTMNFTADRGFTNVAAATDVLRAANYLLMPEAINASATPNYQVASSHINVYLNTFAIQAYGGLYAPTTGISPAMGSNSSNGNFFIHTMNDGGYSAGGATDNVLADYIGMWTSTRPTTASRILYKDTATYLTDAVAEISVSAQPLRLIWGDGSTYLAPPNPGTRMAYMGSGGGYSATDVANDRTVMLNYLTNIGAN